VLWWRRERKRTEKVDETPTSKPVFGFDERYVWNWGML
jgi:hypothetical protein